VRPIVVRGLKYIELVYTPRDAGGLTCVLCKLEYMHLYYQDYENKLDAVNFIMHNSFVIILQF
jgi:hypothetical protein